MEVTEDSAKAMKVDELKSALTAKGCTFSRSDKKADLLAKLLASLHSSVTEDAKDLTASIVQDHSTPGEAMEEISAQQTNGVSCINCLAFATSPSLSLPSFTPFILIYSLLCRQHFSYTPLALAIKCPLFQI
jgi:hypothetical protein